MRAVRATTERVEAAKSAPEPPKADPVASLARAAQIVRQAIALEHKLRTAAPSPAAQPTPGLNPAIRDKRRRPLRETLHKAAQAETDAKRRNQFCRHIDERLDAELLADPDAQQSS